MKGNDCTVDGLGFVQEIHYRNNPQEEYFTTFTGPFPMLKTFSPRNKPSSV